MRCITQDSLEKQNRTHTDVTEDIRTSMGVQWLRPDLSFQCRGHRFDSFSGNLQAEWCGQKKKERDLYALASEVMEDEKFHDLPCHLQAGIIQSQIKSPRIESSRVQGCWAQGAGWKGREGRRMAQLQNGEREPPFLHFVPFGSSKPR